MTVVRRRQNPITSDPRLSIASQNGDRRRCYRADRRIGRNKGADRHIEHPDQLEHGADDQSPQPYRPSSQPASGPATIGCEIMNCPSSGPVEADEPAGESDSEHKVAMRMKIVTVDSTCPTFSETLLHADGMTCEQFLQRQRLLVRDGLDCHLDAPGSYRPQRFQIRVVDGDAHR